MKSNTPVYNIMRVIKVIVLQEEIDIMHLTVSSEVHYCHLSNKKVAEVTLQLLPLSQTIESLLTMTYLYSKFLGCGKHN